MVWFVAPCVCSRHIVVPNQDDHKDRADRLIGLQECCEGSQKALSDSGLHADSNCVHAWPKQCIPSQFVRTDSLPVARFARQLRFNQARRMPSGDSSHSRNFPRSRLLYGHADARRVIILDLRPLARPRSGFAVFTARTLDCRT